MATKANLGWGGIEKTIRTLGVLDTPESSDTGKTSAKTCNNFSFLIPKKILEARGEPARVGLRTRTAIHPSQRAPSLTRKPKMHITNITRENAKVQSAEHLRVK